MKYSGKNKSGTGFKSNKNKTKSSENSGTATNQGSNTVKSLKTNNQQVKDKSIDASFSYPQKDTTAIATASQQMNYGMGNVYSAPFPDGQGLSQHPFSDGMDNAWSNPSIVGMPAHPFSAGMNNAWSTQTPGTEAAKAAVNTNVSNIKGTEKGMIKM